jgi:hypothetical protein
MNIAYPSLYRVNNVTSSAFRVLPGMGDEDGIGVLIEDLFDTTFIAAFLRLWPVRSFIIIFYIGEIMRACCRLRRIVRSRGHVG